MIGGNNIEERRITEIQGKTKKKDERREKIQGIKHGKRNQREISKKKDEWWMVKIT